MSNWQPLGEVAERVSSPTQEAARQGPRGLEWMTIEESAIMFGELKGYAAKKAGSQAGRQ